MQEPLRTEKLTKVYKLGRKKGNKTAVEISDISTSKLSDALFTKAYLENLSK